MNATIRNIAYSLIALTTLLGNISAFSQYDPTSNRRILPQPPQAAAYARYGEIPVNTATGVPNIEVPIYTVSMGSLSLPISISYHSAGTKVNDISSEVGTGWVLNNGGVITRAVFGRADENADNELPFYTSAESLSARIQSASTLEHRDLAEAVHWSYMKIKEVSSDRFSYRLANGKSGVFRRQYPNGQFKTIPYDPIKIDLISTTFVITDVDGTKYTFLRNLLNGEDATLWYLSSIISANGADSILLYSHNENIYRNTFSQFGSFGAFMTAGEAGPYPMPDWTRYDADRIRDGGIGCPPENEVLPVPVQPNMPIAKAVPVNVKSDVVLLDSIVTRSARVRFFYLQDRQDHQTGDGFAPKSRLSRIEVLNAQGTLVKKAEMQHSYFGNSVANRRLRLDKVILNGNEAYQFNYEDNPNIVAAYPEMIGLSQNQFQEDFWGYNNGVFKQGNFSSEFCPSDIGGSMYPSELYTKMCQLKEIVYPTGGKTEFEFENHKLSPDVYRFQSANKPADGSVGGLRIKSIKNYSGNSAVPEVKTYEYDFGPVSQNSHTGRIVHWNFSYVDNIYNAVSKKILVPGSPPTTDVEITCSYTGFTSKNVVTNQPFLPIIGTAGYPIVYNKVTEYLGNNLTNSGKTVFTYQPFYPDFEYNGPDARFAVPYHADRGDYSPKLEMKEVFKKVGSEYKLIAKTKNLYSGFKDFEFQTGINVKSDVTYDGYGILFFPDGVFDSYTSYNAWPYLSGLIMRDTKAYQRVDLLTDQEEHIIDDNNNSVITIRNFGYDNNSLHLQKTSEHTINSKGQVSETEYKYPTDFSQTSPYAEMVQKNILNREVEAATYVTKNSVRYLRQKTKTNFKNWGNDIIEPENKEIFLANGPSQISTTYHKYDGKGNVTSVSGTDGIIWSYIWGHDKTLPIAEVKNAIADDIAYTSFETQTDEGGWLFYNNPFYLTSDVPNMNYGSAAFTGERIYNLQYALNGGIKKTGLNVNKKYRLTLSYMQGEPEVTVGHLISKTIRQAGKGWNQLEIIFDNSNSVILPQITTDSYIDELRLSPVDAEMTTIAYTPLIGMLSQCDSRNQVTRYEYDTYGRLKLIRDTDGNILKRYCYNYAGETNGCQEWKPVIITGYNEFGNGGMTLKFTDRITGRVQTFQLKDYELSLPVLPGLYSIELTVPASTNWCNFHMCGGNFINVRGSHTIYYAEVSAGSCNTIQLTTGD